MKTPETESPGSLERSVRRPLMPYDEWRALGSEKAAEYLARRRGYSAEQQGKLWAILAMTWDEPPNAKLRDAGGEASEQH